MILPCARVETCMYVMLSESLLVTGFCWISSRASWRWHPILAVVSKWKLDRAEKDERLLPEYIIWFENYVLVLNKDQVWTVKALRICSCTFWETVSPLLWIDLLRLCVTIMLLWTNMQTIVFRKAFPVEGKKMLAMGKGKFCISEEKLAQSQMCTSPCFVLLQEFGFFWDIWLGYMGRNSYW